MTPRQAVRMYAKTGQIRSIMAVLQCNFYNAKKLVEAGGGKVTGRKKSKLAPAEMVELYKTHSMNQVARLNGTSYTVVNRVLHAAGVSVRSRGSGSGFPRPAKHGHARDALQLGLTVERYLRLRAVLKLGGACSACGCDDLRVLQLNHVNGEGALKKGGKRCRRAKYRQCLDILAGKSTPFLDVLCANCNLLHEYARGNLKDIRELLLGYN